MPSSLKHSCGQSEAVLNRSAKGWPANESAPAPLVSIGIPVHNGQKYLSNAIESVLSQDFRDFELILCDNASTDATSDICRRYATADSRIRYFRNPNNIGAIPNFNLVFSRAKGKYFKWLCYDDACHPRFLSRCVEVMSLEPETTSIVYSHAEMIDEAGDFRGNLTENVETSAKAAFRRLRTAVLRRGSALALCGLIRSEHLKRTRMRGSYVMDDVGLLTELALVGGFRQVPEALLRIRVHSGNARVLHQTTRSHAMWIDPANVRNKIVLSPNLRLFLECFRSTFHVSMPVSAKIACYAMIPLAYMERPLRDLAGVWKRRLFRA